MVQACTFHCLLSPVHRKRTAVTAGLINTESGMCDWALCSCSPGCHAEPGTLKGKQMPLTPVPVLRCLLITMVSDGRGSPGGSLLRRQGRAGQGWVGGSSYVEGESIVERILTTSARCVGEMCWVMWTMESMATSGLACTKLERRLGIVKKR